MAFSGQAASQTGNLSTLRAEIETRVAGAPGAVVGVAYADLASGDTLHINSDSTFHAASTMKVPVMIELFRQAGNGGFSLGQGLMIVNRFASIVDGSGYSLDVGSDSDSSLYRLNGQRVRVDSLLKLMITRSSNLATNTLITLVGAERVTASMRALGAGQIMVRRGVEDQKAFDAKLNNTTTARDLAIIMRAIEEGSAADASATRAMREILLAQEFNEKIPSGVPAGVRVAHKTGEITAHSHDAAIVYPPGRRPYILVVLTRGLSDGDQSSRLIGDISRMVYTHAIAPR
ncbi:MAG: serine hydrolase [Gemmatimonadaceae bacterium]|nr:serine hydrolase [Gemmatimonadaceae bacterium]